MKEITFTQFWDAYGLKRDKIAAERAWKRLGKRDQLAAFSGIKVYREDCEKNGRMMMYAQGYITHRRWEDELEPPPSVSKPMAQPPADNRAAAVSAIEERERADAERMRRREEWGRQSVSHEQAKLSPEYLKALEEN